MCVCVRTKLIRRSIPSCGLIRRNWWRELQSVNPPPRAESVSLTGWPHSLDNGFKDSSINRPWSGKPSLGISWPGSLGTSCECPIDSVCHRCRLSTGMSWMPGAPSMEVSCRVVPTSFTIGQIARSLCPSLSVKDAYKLLVRKNSRPPHCVAKFTPVYPDVVWPDAWQQVHCCAIDRQVTDLAWKIAHGVLYTAATFPTSVGIAWIPPVSAVDIRVRTSPPFLRMSPME